MRVYDLFLKGGPIMWPMLGLSVATIACALERSWFWFQLLTKEDRIVREVLDAARYNLAKAAEIAAYSQTLAIGRFLLAPLQLKQPTPETFRLAMESAGDKEFMQMRKGDKLLETVVAIAPLLGLLGTVIGLITTFNNLNIGGGGGGAEAGKAAAGIGEALIATASGMIVAIIALSIFRVLVVFQARQVDYFYAAGSELELIYRQVWYEPLTNPGERSPYSTPTAPPSDSPVRAAGVSGRWSVQWMVDGADTEGQNIHSGSSSLPSDYQNGGEESTRPVTKSNATFES